MLIDDDDGGAGGVDGAQHVEEVADHGRGETQRQLVDEQ